MVEEKNRQQKWHTVTIEETRSSDFSLSCTENILEYANTEDNIAGIAKEFMLSAE